MLPSIRLTTTGGTVSACCCGCTNQVVEDFASSTTAGLDGELGHTLTDLDGRFATVRMAESNLCNLLGDVFRRACSADVCILNSGTFRWIFVLDCLVWMGVMCAS